MGLYRSCDETAPQTGFIPSFIIRFPIRRSGALQRTFNGKPSSLPWSWDFLNHVNDGEDGVLKSGIPRFRAIGASMDETAIGLHLLNLSNATPPRSHQRLPPLQD